MTARTGLRCRQATPVAPLDVLGRTAVTTSIRSRTAACTLAAATALAVVATAPAATPATAGNPLPARVLEKLHPTPGEASGENGEAATAAAQLAQARTRPRASSRPARTPRRSARSPRCARRAAAGSTVTGGVEYNSDDPRYRDYFVSNASGGLGDVTGRMTGLAVDDDRVRLRGRRGRAACSGARPARRHLAGRSATRCRRSPPATSRSAPTARCGTATGEANTNADAYLGTGVYRLADPPPAPSPPPAGSAASSWSRTTINKLRFDDAATPSRPPTAACGGTRRRRASGAWTLLYAPNPDYLPGGSHADDPAGAVQEHRQRPRDPAGDRAARSSRSIGWRSGDNYNGFYTQRRQRHLDASHHGLGDLPPSGRSATSPSPFAADGSRSTPSTSRPSSCNTSPDSGLAGIYVSKSAPPPAPGRRSPTTSSASGSPTARHCPTQGYSAGVQAWYNQFLTVDPADADHVYPGLEEVFETTRRRRTWSTVGPYWNFSFPCWDIDPAKQTRLPRPPTPTSTASRSAARQERLRRQRRRRLQAPGRRHPERLGHATDWTALNDGTIDTLQYYSVGVGNDLATGERLRGHPLRRAHRRHPQRPGGHRRPAGQRRVPPAQQRHGRWAPTSAETAATRSPTRRNGCNIAEEYVYLSIQVTQDCAVNDGRGLPQRPPAVRNIAPGDTQPDPLHRPARGRREEPSTLDRGRPARLGADQGLRHPQRRGVDDRVRPRRRTHRDRRRGLGRHGVRGLVRPLQQRGLRPRHLRSNAAAPLARPHPAARTAPCPTATSAASPSTRRPHRPTAYLTVNGFSRQWTEGPGAGIGHVFESTDGGTTWKDISANLPDVPANAILASRGNVVVVDRPGVFAKAAASKRWQKLGTGLPLTVALDLDVHRDVLYAATHGRGLWSFDLRQVGFRGMQAAPVARYRVRPQRGQCAGRAAGRPRRGSRRRAAHARRAPAVRSSPEPLPRRRPRTPHRGRGRRRRRAPSSVRGSDRQQPLDELLELLGVAALDHLVDHVGVGRRPRSRRCTSRRAAPG